MDRRRRPRLQTTQCRQHRPEALERRDWGDWHREHGAGRGCKPSRGSLGWGTGPGDVRQTPQSLQGSGGPPGGGKPSGRGPCRAPGTLARGSPREVWQGRTSPLGHLQGPPLSPAPARPPTPPPVGELHSPSGTRPLHAQASSISSPAPEADRSDGPHSPAHQPVSPSRVPLPPPWYYWFRPLFHTTPSSRTKGPSSSRSFTAPVQGHHE